MWNMTQPERSTAASGRQTASSASPASCSRTVGSSRRPSASDEPDAERRQRDDDGAASITARTGSRRPRPSRRWRGSRRVVLDLLAQAADVDGHGAGVERGLVAPDAAHQLVAREDAPRVAGEEPEQVELLRGQPQLGSPALRDLARRARRSRGRRTRAARRRAGRRRRGAARCARARRARAARTASSRSRRRRARARRCGRPPRRARSA